MSDLFSPLRTHDSERTVGLPADEVRRLGDHARHRRTALRTAAAACVVGAVATVTALVSTGTSTSAPDPASPAPAPSPSRTEELEPGRLIPSAFPLDSGLPVSAGTPDLSGPAAVPFPDVIPPVCGSRYVLPGEPLDRQVMEGTNPVFQGVRDLAVYGSTRQAVQAIEEQAQRLRGCPTERAGGTLATTSLQPLDLGDQGWRAARVYTSRGRPVSVEVYFLVQRGPAALVMVQSLFDEPAPIPNGAAIDISEELDSFVEDQERGTVAPLVEALCQVETVCD